MEAWTLETFSGLVGEMRAAQARSYRNRRRASPEQHHKLLADALDLECRVDEALATLAERRPLFDREGTTP